jgi:glutamate N-acetyltransferase/amino-acid N-acetyltransferase
VSFNAITVDGDMSTNDTVLVLANGMACNPAIHEKDKSFDVFRAKLEQVSVDLAKMVVADGEGATKFIKVLVTGARNDQDARKIASSIGSSVLVKCAVQGGDPNWGRIASSAGASGADIVPERMAIKLDGVVFFSKGCAAPHADRKKSKVFKGKEVLVELDAGLGAGKAVLYSCDISKRYITLNSYYTT